MKQTLLFSMVSIGAMILLSSCGDSAAGGAGSLDIILTSSDISRDTMGRGTPCNVTYNRTRDEGECYTPLSVKGIFNSATLGKTTGGAPIRMLGGGSLTGLEAVFHHGAFDLATSPTITGEDTFEEATGSYNLVSMSLQAIEYKFQADTTDQYYHVRIPFAHPKPSNDATFGGCGWGGGIDEADGFGTFWDGFEAEPTDILVCIKATADATCTDAEFQWVDGTVLAATRPVSPKQVADTGYLMTASACSRDTTWGYTSVDIGLSTGVEATASFEGGTKTYTVGSTTGTRLSATIDFDLTNSLFVKDTLAIDLGDATQAQVLGAIDTILPKPIYLNSVKTTAATEVDGMFQASATLAVE